MKHEVHFGVGVHISGAASELVAAAKEHGAASGRFNDVLLEAEASSTVDGVVRHFEAETARLAKQYRESPAGIAGAQERDDRRRSLQGLHDDAVGRLPKIDFENDIAVLDWICAIQDATDHVGVIVRKNTILSAFESRGFVAGENCGPDYRPGDRENMFRYLVGQALDGLKNGPAIHPIIHKFVGEFKAQFTTAAPPQSEDAA